MIFSDRMYILDEDRKPVAVPLFTDWLKWMRDGGPHKCRVGLTTISTGCCVSTVFIHCDMACGAASEPLVFETMIQGGPFNGERMLYGTWEKARAGHMVAVERARGDKVVVPLRR